jgi:death on curing protein
MTRYLTVEQVLFIHARLMAETGGGHGVRDLGLLESAVVRPRATFDEAELYPNLFSKAAALLHSLVNNNPFVDGNKRTGITAAGLFLAQNGVRLVASNAELEAFMLSVVTSSLEMEEIATWFETNSRS